MDLPKQWLLRKCSNNMKNPLLEIIGLDQEYKTFKGPAKVLNGVDFYVHEREKVGLIGESGSGKTTTMKCIMRILPEQQAKITHGEILFKEKNLLKVRRGYGVKGISMIFQDPTASLNPVFTVGQQLIDVAKYSKVLGNSKGNLNKKSLDLCLKTLSDVNMADPERIMKYYPVQLSGGMRQRICIAKALIGVRDLLIADEPGTNLDVTIQDQILRLINQLVEERKNSIILISHAIGTMKNLTDRVYCMYAGTMVEVAKTEELLIKPLHPYTVELLASVPKLTGEGVSSGIPGTPPDYLKVPTGCRFHPRCKHAMNKCKQEKPSIFNLGNDRKVSCFLFEN